MTGNAARVDDLHELAGIWRRRGLTVLEMPGWQARGRSATMSFDVLGVHHTAASVDVDRILRDGRPDVPGPLCNVALHANGDVVLVASGRANHFGVATWSSSRALGVEATGPPFPNYEAYVQLAAGFCEWRHRGPTAVVADMAIPVHIVAAHKEVALPYGRKPDPAFAPRSGDRVIAGVRLIDGFRTDVRVAMTAKEEDMPTEAEFKRAVIAALVDQRRELAVDIAEETAVALKPLLQELSGSPHVFIRKPGDNTIYVVTPAGPIHVPNPSVFGVLSGNEGIAATTIEVPEDDPIWS